MNRLRAIIIFAHFYGGDIPTEEIIDYLDSFSADADRKRKTIQSEVNEANKIKSKKY